MSAQFTEPGQIVQDIIQQFLGLADGQVMFTNEPYEIPTDNNVLIVVSYAGPGKQQAIMKEYQLDGEGNSIELISQKMLDMLQIDILSYRDSARTYRTLVPIALGSTLSEQMQEQYNMHISRHVGAILDTSFVEKSRIVTRYTMTVMTETVQQYTAPVAFLTGFKVQLNLDPPTPAPIEADPAQVTT
jgi:hypothetical protein